MSGIFRCAALIAVLSLLASPGMAQTAKASLKDQKGADVGTVDLT
jgi:hypothetical protein